MVRNFILEDFAEQFAGLKLLFSSLQTEYFSIVEYTQIEFLAGSLRDSFNGGSGNEIKDRMNMTAREQRKYETIIKCKVKFLTL